MAIQYENKRRLRDTRRLWNTRGGTRGAFRHKWNAWSVRRKLVTEMRRGRIRKLGILLLGFLLAVNTAAPALAAVPDYLARNLALRVVCQPDGEGVAGMQFQLYYLASVADDGSYMVVEPYASAGITAEMLSDGTRRAEAIAALAAFLNGGGASADAQGTTNDVGQTIIQNLADGIYLCSSNTRYVKADGTTYTPVAFLFRLNAALVRDRVQVTPDEITAITKFSVGTTVTPTGGDDGGDDRTPPTTPPGDDTTPDDGTPPGDDDTPSNRPPTNNPTGDPSDTPQDDETDITDEGTPTGERDDPDPTPESSDETPETTEETEIVIDIPEEEVPLDYVEILDDPLPLSNLELPDPDDEDSDDFLNIEDEDVPLADMLPQTGLLWWPVPVMAVMGLVLFLVGWRKTRRA